MDAMLASQERTHKQRWKARGALGVAAAPSQERTAVGKDGLEIARSWLRNTINYGTIQNVYVSPKSDVPSSCQSASCGAGCCPSTRQSASCGTHPFCVYASDFFKSLFFCLLFASPPVAVCSILYLFDVVIVCFHNVISRLAPNLTIESSCAP